MRSAVSWPCSVRNTWWLFSSSVKSPGRVTPSPVRRSASPSWRTNCGTNWFIVTYRAWWSSAWPADDQRRARLVDQDGIDLIDDGVVQALLHAVLRFVDHVVAQIVEAVF